MAYTQRGEDSICQGNDSHLYLYLYLCWEHTDYAHPSLRFCTAIANLAVILELVYKI